MARAKVGLGTRPRTGIIAETGTIRARTIWLGLSQIIGVRLKLGLR